MYEKMLVDRVSLKHLLVCKSVNHQQIAVLLTCLNTVPKVSTELCTAHLLLWVWASVLLISQEIVGLKNSRQAIDKYLYAGGLLRRETAE